jgi:hypothetical protein
MASAELLVDAFGRIRGVVHRVVGGLTPEQLAFRVDAEGIPAPAPHCGTAELSSIHPRSCRSGVDGGSRESKTFISQAACLSVCGSGDLLDCHQGEANQTVLRTIAAIQSMAA